MNFTNIAAAWARFEHGVAAILSFASVAQQDVAALQASNPLIGAAITAGEAMATAHGVPVASIVTGAETLLAAAQAVAAVKVTGA